MTPRAMQVQAMLDAGMRQCQIAIALGVNQQTVSMHVKKHGLHDPFARPRRSEPVVEWLPDRPIVVQVPQPRPRPVKTGIPFSMRAMQLPDPVLALGRRTSAVRDA
jgi:hypothetical protein